MKKRRNRNCRFGIRPGTKRRQKRGMAAGMLALALTLTALLPSPDVLADDVTVPADGSTDEQVTATFTIDEETLASLGYGVVASIPVSMSLSYNASAKNFSNSAEVYCSGVLADGKQVSVSVNESGDRYGKVYDSSDRASSVKGKTGFAVSMSKTTWTKAECMENLTKLSSSEDATQTGKLSVAVPGKGFIPSGTGTFKTYVPLVIRLESGA